MAPNRSFKTYSRGRNTSISSAQAFDILFANNLTKRKLHGAVGKKKNKNKFEVKQLQTRIKTILQDEPSFQVNVNINDTFDNIFKQQGKIKGNDKLNNLKSVNVSNATSSSFTRSQSSHYVSVALPMVRKLRSFSKLSQSSNSSSNILKSWFEKPTPPGMGITNSLEIEVASKNWKKNNSLSKSGGGIINNFETSGNNSQSKSGRESPIMLRSGSKSRNKSKDTAIPKPSKQIKAVNDNLINPVFTRSLRERMLFHSSTPVVATRSKKVFQQPISPINSTNKDEVSKCIFESLEEIKRWNTSLASSTEPSSSKSAIKTFENSQPKRLSTLTVNFEAFEGFLTQSMNKMMKNHTNMTAYDFEEHQKRSINQLMKNHTNMTAYDFEEHQKRSINKMMKNHTNMTACDFEEHQKSQEKNQRKSQRDETNTTNISLTEFESFYTTLYEENLNIDNNVVTNNSSFYYKSHQRNNFITHRRRAKSPVSSSNSQGKQLQVVLNDLNKPTKPKSSNFQQSTPFNKQLVIKLPRLSLPVAKPKTSLRNNGHHLTNSSEGASIISRTQTELSLYMEGSKSISETAGSFNQSTSQVIINAKESSVLHLRTRSLGFEDISEKENEPSSSRSSRIPKRKSLLQSPLPEKRYLQSSITENNNRPSTSTANHNISEDLFTTGDFTNNSAQYELSLLLTSTTEIANTSSKSPTKNTMSSFCYDDPREQSQITDYYKGVSELESSQKSWILKSDTSYVPENDIIVIDDSCIDESKDAFDKSAFKIPLAPINRQVKTGKSFRRSIRGSFINKSPFKTVNRPSVKIVPLESEGRQLRRLTVLQNYISPNKTVRPSLTAREIVLKYCKQSKPEQFETLYPISLLEGSKKIGEGVYGEVFLCPKENGKMTVMKIIPIEGDKIINGEKQKMFHEILSEVVIVSQLSNLRNNNFNKTSAFCEVQKISCVLGKYPKILSELWDEYDKAKGSENDPPDIFDDDQLYVVLELGNAGQDLEAFVFQNASQSLAMFKQIALALAVSEEQLQFEHRDLHWGNVLLRPIDKDRKTTFKFKGKPKSFASEGVEATIIDFTLSRVVHDGVVIFNDLSQDPDLFVATGDYQFDIYRLMKEKNNNDWKSFTPYSNILWLHYILKKSMTDLRYKNPKTKIHTKYINLLKKYEGIILNFDSVSEFVTANL